MLELGLKVGFAIYSTVVRFDGVFSVRNIGPELTSVASLPLFCLKKIVDEPTSAAIFLYFVLWDAATAWLDEWC